MTGVSVGVVSTRRLGFLTGLPRVCEQQSRVAHRGGRRPSRVGAMYARNVVRLDARPAVGLVVNDDAGANTVAMTREMERTLETLLREVPAV